MAAQSLAASMANAVGEGIMRMSDAIGQVVTEAVRTANPENANGDA